jgi:uncharacterized protein affecting Mg2+/Co2+ transport
MEHRSLAVDAGVAGTPTPRIVGRRQTIAEALARVRDRVLGTHTIGEQPDTPSGPGRARHRLHLAHHAGRMAQRQVMSAA